MDITIVYDTYYGNTEKVARAVKEALDGAVAVKAAEFDIKSFKGGMLIIGSPTRAFRPSPAVKKLLKQMTGLKGVKCAVFDTRVNAADVNSRVLNFFVKRFGYAAGNMAKILSKKGAEVISSEGFYVKESEGPLKDNEIGRAAEWAKSLIK